MHNIEPDYKNPKVLQLVLSVRKKIDTLRASWQQSDYQYIIYENFFIGDGFNQMYNLDRQPSLDQFSAIYIFDGTVPVIPLREVKEYTIRDKEPHIIFHDGFQPGEKEWFVVMFLSKEAPG